MNLDRGSAETANGDRPGWIPTRSATPSTALVPQRKVGFPIRNPRLLLGFQGTKSARREGISSPFSDAGGCTSRQNSGWQRASRRFAPFHRPQNHLPEMQARFIRRENPAITPIATVLLAIITAFLAYIARIQYNDSGAAARLCSFCVRRCSQYLRLAVVQALASGLRIPGKHQPISLTRI